MGILYQYTSEIQYGAMTAPINKSGQRFDFYSYRPSSVLLTVNLFKKIVHDGVSMFIKENGLFSNYQHDFRQLHSTVTSLLGVTDSWFSRINRKQ